MTKPTSDHQLTQEQITEWTRQSCEAQGVPVKVTDPNVVDTVVILLGRDQTPSDKGTSQ